MYKLNSSTKYYFPLYLSTPGKMYIKNWDLKKFFLTRRGEIPCKSRTFLDSLFSSYHQQSKVHSNQHAPMTIWVCNTSITKKTLVISMSEMVSNSYCFGYYSCNSSFIKLKRKCKNISNFWRFFCEGPSKILRAI